MHHRPGVLMPSRDSKVGREEYNHERPDHTAPVHIYWRRTGFRWNELEDPKYDEESEGDDVDDDAPFTKVEA